MSARPIHLPTRRSGPRLAQRGLTLIEWLISITIGTFLLVALLALVAQQSLTQAELDRSSRQIENGRYAMQLLSDDLTLAGYYGEFGNLAGVAVPTALPDPCSLSAADQGSAIPFAVQGYNAPTGSLTASFGSCPANTLVDANHVNGTDILVVRHTDLTQVAPTALTVNQMYMQSGLAAGLQTFNYAVGVATATTLNPAVFGLLKKDGTTPAPMRRYLVHIYFVSPCNVPSTGSTCTGSDDGGTPIPTLKRLELTVDGGTTRFVMTPLVEGIENMQVDYGVDTAGADGVPDGAFVTAPATVAGWADVMGMRVHLLARNSEPSSGHNDGANTYNLGLAGTFTPATGDRFKRRVFSQSIRLVNPSGRRDS